MGATINHLLHGINEASRASTPKVASLVAQAKTVDICLIYGSGAEFSGDCKSGNAGHKSGASNRKADSVKKRWLVVNSAVTPRPDYATLVRRANEWRRTLLESRELC